MRCNFDKRHNVFSLEFDDQRDLEAFLRTIAYARFLSEAHPRKGVETRYLIGLEEHLMEENQEAKEMLLQFFGVNYES